MPGRKLRLSMLVTIHVAPGSEPNAGHAGTRNGHLELSVALVLTSTRCEVLDLLDLGADLK